MPAGRDRVYSGECVDAEEIKYKKFHQKMTEFAKSVVYINEGIYVREGRSHEWVDGHRDK